jgi:uncharacterized membrane protein
MDLLVIGSVMLLGVLLALVSGGALRAAIGLALVLLLPGYTLTAAAFPRKDDLEPLERLALSFGLSVATAVLVGLGLGYSPWGAKLVPILLSLALFIVVTSATAYYCRRRLPRTLPPIASPAAFSPRLVLGQAKGLERSVGSCCRGVRCVTCRDRPGPYAEPQR